MKNRLTAVLCCMLMFALVAIPLCASDEGKPVTGAPGPIQGVVPTSAKPTLATAQALNKTEENEAAEANTPAPSSEHSAAERNRRKSLAQRPNLKTGGREIHVDSTPTPLAPNVGTNFNGLGQNGWIPYDAAIAVGPSHIVVMTNAQWIVYDRAGATVRAVTDFGTWWGTPAGTPFDPKCFYDPVGGRFVMLAVSQTMTGGNKAFYHLSISQTGDPTGSWYNYQFDATKDGTTSTAFWADFPGLGYDDNSIYTTSNQFTFSLTNPLFQYAKIRVYSKAQLYAGSAATFTDFVGATLRNSDGSQVFTVQPARTLSSTSSEYFLNTNSSSNNSVTLWRMDGAPGSPTLVRQTTYSVGAFNVPPDAVQKGSATLVATNDDRMYDFVWRSGTIHASFGESFSGLAAVRYLRLSTTSNTVLKDVTYTQPGVQYYFPAVTDDSAGNLYMIFSRSSSTEFPSVYQTGMTPSDSAIEPSALVKAGVASNTSGRWGDYSAIVNDPADSLAVVSYAGWGNTSNRWATWITGMTFAGGTPTPTLLSVTPSSGTQGTNVNVTLAGQNTHWVQGTSVITISGAGVTASNVSVTSATSLTATFNITAGAATGTRNVTVTTGAEVTTSSPFTINAAPVATLNSVNPNSGLQGQNVNVTLSGTNTHWVQGTSVIGISGSNVSASNISVASATALTATFNITAGAATGTRNVTVTTGTEVTTSAPFTVNPAGSPPTLTSIREPRGFLGATTTHTFTGANFVAGMTVNVSGTLASASNVNVTSSTQATVDITVAANAALGGRTVSVTTPAGTSGTVAYTIVGVPVITSISPVSGNPGTTVGVTILGSQFSGGTPLISGNGVSIQFGAQILNGGTKITANFIIAANAAAGARNVTVTNGAGASNAVLFSVNGGTNPPTLASVTPANGDPGTSVGVTLNGTNFTTTSTINVSGGDVTVTNLNVLNNAQITATLNINAGAPAGPRNVSVTTGAGTSGSQTFSVNGTVGNPSVTTSSLPAGEVGANYNSTLNATGGATPYSWSITSGALPGGLNLAPSTGVISGTPTAGGLFNFTATVTDANNHTGNAPLSISIATAPSISTSSLPNGQVGIGYNSTVQVTGGTAPFSWSISVGALPANLGINSGTGAITGSPTSAGTSNFTVTVTDAFGQSANKALSIVVNPAVSITTTSLLGGQVGVSYNSSVAATGGTLPYGWTITAGALPTNLGINSSTGAITGTPTAAGTFNFTVTVTDGLGQTANNALSIVVNPAVSVTTTSLPGGQVGVSYNSTVAATGGTLPYGWTITAGALPSNLGINSTTGAITGSPTAAGTFNFTVTVTDGVVQTANKALSIVVNPAVSITTTSLPGGQVNAGYNASVAATGGTLPYGWTITAGALPTNLGINSSTGAITGTPTAAGTSNFTVTVTDGVGQQANKPLSIVISSVAAPTLTSVTPNQGGQGSVTPVTLTGTNFVAPFTLNISSPAGLTASNVVLVNAQTITADFTSAPGAAIGNRTLSITTPGGTTTGNVWFKIVGLPSITSIMPTSGARGTTVNVTLQGSQFTGGTPAISGTGVTIGTGPQILNNGTTYTLKLIIAAGAPVGPRDVTVFNAAGTSNAVTFTVN